MPPARVGNAAHAEALPAEIFADLAQAAAQPSAATCDETVLLVEDEESVRELVRETLEGKGYRILLAEHGHAGIDRAATCNENIDLLITDMVMPGMGGRELASRLLAARPGLKVLFLSGYAADQGAAHLDLEMGQCFLQKPFTLQALADKVRQVLDR